MIAKILIVLSLTISTLMIVVPNVLASSSIVISGEKAGGYEYTITKEKNKYTWKIGHEENISVVEENKENREELDYYKQVVSDIRVQLIKVFLFASSFLVLAIITMLLHTKNKLRFKSGGATTIALVAIFVLTNTFVTSVDLSFSFDNAKFYYFRLTN